MLSLPDYTNGSVVSLMPGEARRIDSRALCSSKGTLYLCFSKSIDASLLDGIAWMRTMEQRVKSIANPLAGKDIELIITDIDLLVPQK